MTESTKIDTLPSARVPKPVLRVRFYASESGRELVREWLKSLDDEDRRLMGWSLKKAQFGWPVGLPLIRKMEDGLWEIRVRILNGIGRVFFTVDRDNMVLVHGFVKKSQTTPGHELDTARRRVRQYLGGQHEEESAPRE